MSVFMPEMGVFFKPFTDTILTCHQSESEVSPLEKEAMGGAKDRLTPTQAKAQVMDHWEHLNALATRRFRQDENLAHEAVLYILVRLEKDDWQRVRTWQGQGDFLPYLSTIIVRLLTDFSRHKFGHIRKPAWLKDKDDHFWDRAYQLLIVEKYTRHEAAAVLELIEPPRDSWFIRDVISTILAKCKPLVQPLTQNVSIDDGPEPPQQGAAPDEQLAINHDELLHALLSHLDDNQQRPSEHSSRVTALTDRIGPLLHLTQEDRMLLKLRFQEGMKLQAIVKLLDLKGDPYKRLNKLLRTIRIACQEAGIFEDEALPTPKRYQA